ncbi:MAG TPA: DUF5683 domain-containing protein [Bacteroidia bacterium]|nr:DUF5683 domain-containing protein [Bacteroidia bacterium]HNU34486.1 DUF5683 domain-containing protein [Bacteroidia bacterium]
MNLLFKAAVIFFLLPAFGLSQNKTSTTDSVVLKHSPHKATIYSTVLPGLGQAYNKKYWKIPIIYVGFGVSGYFAVDNQKQYKKYKEAYAVRLDGDENTIDQFADSYTDEDLRLLKNFYRRNRDLSYVSIGLIYVLNIVDATVDAHLFQFNVDDNLSLQWSPAPVSNTGAMGLCMALKF